MATSIPRRNVPSDDRRLILGHYEEKGRAEFQAEVNRIFERNGIAFELVDGEVKRLGPAGFHEALGTAIFKTGDGPLDEMLEDARQEFLNRDLKMRRESLERLWDAWERLNLGVGLRRRVAETSHRWIDC